jgi:hypothetical protein
VKLRLTEPVTMFTFCRGYVKAEAVSIKRVHATPFDACVLLQFFNGTKRHRVRLPTLSAIAVESNARHDRIDRDSI